MDAAPSPVEAAREAYHHTVRVLFPFRLETWAVLGCVAFLDQCGRGGMGGAVPGVPSGDLPVGGARGPEVAAWMSAHVALLVVGTALLLGVAVGLLAVALWVGSRATFVYADDVARGRAELLVPWHAHAERAASYFAWRFAIALVLLAAVFVLVLLGALVAFGTSRGSPGAIAATVALVVFIPVFLLVLLLGGVLSLSLRDFVAPLQIESNLSCPAAARVLKDLVRAHPTVFLVYLLLKVVFGIVQGTLLVLSACLTCCCILVPVVTQTFLQPLFFFERAWSLCLLRQMGHDVLGRADAPTP